jgi:hypothetical protein
MDPDMIASQLRINQLGGSVLIHPKTGELSIGALFRAHQGGHWVFDQQLADADAFGADASWLDWIREDIVRRSGGSWRPPTTDPDKIREELITRLSVE